MIELQRILCAVDFSEFSRRALDHALSVARGYGSTVTALHVVAPAPAAVAGGYYFGSENPPPLLFPVMDADSARGELQRLVTTEHVPGVKVDSVVAEAYDVYREILAQADRLQSNLVVMGTHGRSGFERLFLGSTAEKVLRKARCPVMTVPPQGAGRDGQRSGAVQTDRLRDRFFEELTRRARLCDVAGAGERGGPRRGSRHRHSSDVRGFRTSRRDRSSRVDRAGHEPPARDGSRPRCARPAASPTWYARARRLGRF